MRLVILGIQGSGKGTQSKLLSEKFNLKHISTGDLIRNEVSKGTELGSKFNLYIKEGKLVPDILLIELLKQNLPKDNFILDGYPRNIEQARELEKLVKIDYVIYLDFPEKEVIKRLSNRYFCPKCNIQYGLNHLPKKKWFCDKCGGKLKQRDDDKPDAIKTRLKIFNKEISILLDFYKDKIIHINADNSVEGVFNEIIQKLNLRKI